MGRSRGANCNVSIVAAITIVLFQLTSVPSSGNVLATPQPARGDDPLYVLHASRQDLRVGEHLFRTNCSACHGLHLQGTAEGPSLRHADVQDVDFQLRTGRMPAPVPFEQEMHKPAYFPPGKMRDVVAYVMSKSTGNTILPTVTVQSGDPALRRGRRLFEANCEQCHSASGHGDSVGFSEVAPSLMQASPQDLADAVRYGPGVMPRFGPTVIDQKSLNDLASYVWYLQRAKYNPGGLQLANWGPTSEGFIAWIFGIGLLVVLARRIGSID